MVDNKHIISLLQAARPTLQKSYGFTSLALFGSYSRNTAVAGESDIDVMVEFQNQLVFVLLTLQMNWKIFLNTK